jgi:hypothetical protein
VSNASWVVVIETLLGCRSLTYGCVTYATVGLPKIKGCSELTD